MQSPRDKPSAFRMIFSHVLAIFLILKPARLTCVVHAGDVVDAAHGDASHGPLPHSKCLQ